METFANWRQAKQYIFIGEKDGKKKKNERKCLPSTCIKLMLYKQTFYWVVEYYNVLYM